MKSDDVIYLDHHASTPLDAEVFEVMLPYLRHRFGNASSRSHVVGRSLSRAIEGARENIASWLNARLPEEIVFTSGATESNNLALLGVGRALLGRGKEVHLLASAVEHSAVSEPLRKLKQEGAEVELIPVDERGVVKLDVFEQQLRRETALVSVMLCNNEVGSFQPISQIGARCRANGTLFHCDAVQGLGRCDVDVHAMNVDLMSVSGHKIYGPQGVGALYMRRGSCHLDPLLFGGGQERGLRPGTLNNAGIVGLGAAANLYCEKYHREPAVRLLRDDLEQSLVQRIPTLKVHGAERSQRHPGNLHFSVPGVRAEDLLSALPDFALSTGSACSGDSGTSPTLMAMGYSESEARSSIRVGLGRFNTGAEVEYFAARLLAEVARINAAAESRSTGAPRDERGPLW